MGYETKLLIGSSRGVQREGETYFEIMCMVDLCQCSRGSMINGLNRVNKDDSHGWYWYLGDKRLSEDAYGDRLKPVPIEHVIEALKVDLENEDYRRLRWAIALLESMADDSEEISVLLYGY